MQPRKKQKKISISHSLRKKTNKMVFCIVKILTFRTVTHAFENNIAFVLAECAALRGIYM